MASVFVVAAPLAGVMSGMGSGTNGLRVSLCGYVASQMVLVVMMGHLYSSDF
ncbi:MAG: hypothetical protein ACRDVK_10005 [Acidimicrobiia bacterium]